jgi:hypothetical protein
VPARRFTNGEYQKRMALRIVTAVLPSPPLASNASESRQGAGVATRFARMAGILHQLRMNIAPVADDE